MAVVVVIISVCKLADAKSGTNWLMNPLLTFYDVVS